MFSGEETASGRWRCCWRRRSTWPVLAADEKHAGINVGSTKIKGVVSTASAADEKPTPVETPKAAAPKPADDKAAQEEPAAEKADPFVVPEGTPKELVAYITKLISAPPPHDRGHAEEAAEGHSASRRKDSRGQAER